MWNHVQQIFRLSWFFTLISDQSQFLLLPWYLNTVNYSHFKSALQIPISLFYQDYVQMLISPTFYKQLLRVQIPKAQKDTDDLTGFLFAWDVGA